MRNGSLPAAWLVVFALSDALPSQGMVTGAFIPAAGRTIGDVTGDGVDDLLLLLGTGSGVLLRVVDPIANAPIPFLDRAGVSIGFPTYFGVGDYDGDGRDDLSYSGYPASTIVSGANGSTLTTVTGLVYGGCDFDGDGCADLLMDVSGVMLVRSARTGSTLFQQPAGAPTGPVYTRIVPAGDTNGDGREDAMITYYYYSIPGDTMFVVRGPAGSGGGSFSDAAPAGDVNGDGKTDIFSCPTFPPGLPRVIYGSSSATAWTIAGGSIGAAGACPGDVDGDGFADLVVNVGGTLTMLSGNTQASLPGVAIPQLPKLLGDLDGDGRAENVMSGGRYEWSDPSLPVASRMARRGTPGATSDGRRPYLVARGHSSLGRTAFFDMRGGLPNGITLLMFGSNVDVDLGPVGAPGNRSYTSLAGGFAFLANSGGIAQYQATIPTAPSLLGASISLQSVVVDSAANALGLVMSNAIDVTTNN